MQSGGVNSDRATGRRSAVVQLVSPLVARKESLKTAARRQTMKNQFGAAASHDSDLEATLSFFDCGDIGALGAACTMFPPLYLLLNPPSPFPPPKKRKDQAACLENIKALSLQMWQRAIRCLLSIASPSALGHFLGCGRRAHLFPADGLSLTQAAASRGRKPKSPPKTLAKRESSPSESCRPCVLSDFASRRACLLFPAPIPFPMRGGLQAA